MRIWRAVSVPIIGALAAIGGNAFAMPVNGLVAYWQADGDATDSQGTFDGVLVGGTTFAPGKHGQAFSFDGVNDQVVFSNSPVLQPSSITVGAWLKTSSTSFQLVVDSSHGWVDALGWAIQLIDGRPCFAYGNGTSFPQACSADPLSDGNFHHVAATLNGPNGTMRLFVDGIEAANAAFLGSPAGNNRSVEAGLTWTQARPFIGLIDEIALYDRALSGDEIVQLMAGEASSPATVPEPGTLALVLAGLSCVALGRRRQCRNDTALMA